MKLFLLIILYLLYCSEPSRNKIEFAGAIAKARAEGIDSVEKPERKLPFLTVKNFDPVWDDKNPKLVKIPEFSFKNQNNSIISDKDLKGKITIACFFYTRCNGFCPHVMRNMYNIKQKFLSDSKIQFVSFSVTPWIDTPELIKEYESKTGFGKKSWNLLTGEKEKIYNLAREVFLADTNTGEKKSQDDFIHSEQVYIIDMQKRLRGVYNGNINGDMERLSHDILTLKKFE